MLSSRGNPQPAQRTGFMTEAIHTISTSHGLLRRVPLLAMTILIFFSLSTYAQNPEDDGTHFLGSVIQDQLESAEGDDIDIIDPDFLKEDGAQYDDYQKVVIRILNKITADTRTYDLEIGKTVAYGNLRIRPMTCKKTPPIEEPESVSFLQIWEKIHEGSDEWVFSGWMFSSSPSLSAMEHPIYDVWVIDCKD